MNHGVKCWLHIVRNRSTKYGNWSNGAAIAMPGWHNLMHLVTSSEKWDGNLSDLNFFWCEFCMKNGPHETGINFQPCLAALQDYYSFKWDPCPMKDVCLNSWLLIDSQKFLSFAISVWSNLIFFKLYRIARFSLLGMTFSVLCCLIGFSDHHPTPMIDLTYEFFNNTPTYPSHRRFEVLNRRKINVSETVS